MRWLPQRRFLPALLALLVTISLRGSSADTVITQVALTGEVAPGGDGAEYEFFYSPISINDAGDVAFTGRLQTGASGAVVDTNNRAAVFGPTSGAGSALGIVARQGWGAPGTNGDSYSGFSGTVSSTPGLASSTGGLRLNANGDVAFLAKLEGVSGATGIGGFEALFGPSPGGGPGVTLVAQVGDTAPGTGGAQYASIARSFALNDAGDVAFHAGLQTGQSSSALNVLNDDAVFGPSAGPGSPLAQIAREGDSLGATVGTLFFFDPPDDRVRYADVSLNAGGQVAFAAYLFVDSDPQTSVRSLFRHSGNAGADLEVLARRGLPVPGDSSIQYRSLFDSPVLNAAGGAAFHGSYLPVGSTSGGARAVFGPVAGDTPTIGPRMREGDLVPQSGGARINWFHDPLMNASGDLLAQASLIVEDPSNAGESLYSQAILTTQGEEESDIVLVAREGNAAPGASDAVFDSFYPSLAFNAAGDIAFLAALRPSDPANDAEEFGEYGLFAYANGAAELIARSGDPWLVQTAGGASELRTIDKLGFSAIGLPYQGNSGGQHGRAGTLNSSGTLAFMLEFTDGTQGVFTAQLREQETGLLGDYNNDGMVDAADYTTWRDNLGAAEGTLPNDTAGGAIGAAQYAAWRAHFGTAIVPAGMAPHAAAPEGASLILLLYGTLPCAWTASRRRRPAGP